MSKSWGAIFAAALAVIPTSSALLAPAVGLGLHRGGLSFPEAALNIVDSNTALIATTNGLQLGDVFRAGFTSSGDGGAMWYRWSVSNCGSADNGLQVQPSTTGCWIANMQVPPDVRVWGAKCDGVTNDGSAINAALTAMAGAAVRIPEGLQCATTTSVVVTEPQTLYSENSALQGGGALAKPTATILCGSSVSPCVSMVGPASGSSSNGATMLRGIAVVSSSSTGAGVQIFRTYDAVLDNVLVKGFTSGITLQPSTIFGISAHFRNVETCQISGNDLIDNSWPELRIDQARFGCNNDNTTRTGSYILIEGGTTGPNTLVVENSQFNAGGGGAPCWLNFASMGSGIGGIISEFTFAHNHLEVGASSQHGVCSDSSATGIFRFFLTGNMFLDNAGTNTFMNLNSATAPNDWTFTGNQWNGWGGGFTIAPSGQFNHFDMEGNVLNGTPFSLTGVSNSTFNGSGTFNGVTLAGNFAHSLIQGTNVGSFSNTATGTITVSFP